MYDISLPNINLLFGCDCATLFLLKVNYLQCTLAFCTDVFYFLLFWPHFISNDVGSEWEGSPDTAYWVYGKEHWKVYERALDASSQCTEKCQWCSSAVLGCQRRRT